MSTNKVHIDSLHFEHTLWNRQLDFERDEINFFNSKLDEVASKWTDGEVLSKVEKFQNKFIRYNEVLDTLKHEIKLHEQTIATKAAEEPNVAQHVLVENHDEIKGKVETQFAIFKEDKEDFLTFLRQSL